MKTALLLILALLSGCAATPPDAKPTSKPGDAAPLHTAIGNADNATKKADDAGAKVDDKTAQRDGALKADINAAKAANQANPAGVPKEQVDAHLDVAGARLDGVVADPKEVAATAERDKLIEQGKAAEARAATDRAIADAKGQAGELAVAKADAKAAIEERDLARKGEKQAVEDLKTKLEANRLENQTNLDAAVRAAHDEERKAQMRKLGYALLGLGVLLLLVGAATLYLTKGMEWQRAAIAAAAGAGCFSLFWTINQPWFKYLVWAVAGVMVVAVLWYLWTEARQHKKVVGLVTRAGEADEAESTLKHFINAVDQSPAGTTIAHLTDKLEKDMSEPHKALLDELRAEDHREAA